MTLRPKARSAAAVETPEDTPASNYVGRLYDREEIPNLPPRLRSAIREFDQRCPNWWNMSSRHNQGGTKLCARHQVIRKRNSQINWEYGPDYACKTCTEKDEPCLHAALIDGQLKLVVKNPLY
jgi:hypothetical protein